MKSNPIAVLGTGLVTSVGLTTAACCCAFRAKITNPFETGFIDSSGAWIVAHQVGLDRPWAGLTKLAKMAALAIDEALQDLDKDQWHRLPLLLCVAEAERPGRMAGLDDQLLLQIQSELGVSFAKPSAVVPHGRVGVAVALAQARALLGSSKLPGVLIVSADSLLSWPTLSHYERDDRLLTEANSNGFMPGEGAGALWVGATDERRSPQLMCTGIGFGREAAHIDSGEPLRADGLTQAIKASLDDAGRELHDMDFRITDNSGEQYYFKEASLALSRTLRQRKDAFDIWHPAECIGEAGAASGVAVIAAAREACRKGYAPGRNVLSHWANDAGQRAAVTLEFRVPG
jgi:3-oxoacyl-[acyl-carrier-protein] synthase-1